MLTDLFVYSFRNLTNRKLRTWLTMFGIVIGIASVIALIGLGGGLRMAITGTFGGVSADILTVQAGGVALSGPPGTGVVNPLKKEYVDDIGKISSVDFSAGRIIESGTLEFNNIKGFGFATSVPGGEARREFYDIFDLKADSGRLLREEDNKKVLLGSDFSKDDNGFERAISTGDKVLINDETFEVVGILESKGSFFFDSAVFINEQPLRDLVDNKDDYDIIVARAKSLNDVDQAKADIEKYLRKKRDVKEGEEDFSVEKAQATLDTINSVLGGVQAFIIIVAAISMVVGAIGIINTMFTAVVERTNEIGIMKSIGAKNSDIFYIFLIESGLLGTVGGLLGIIIGWLAAFGGTLFLSSWLGSPVSPDITLSLVIFALIGSFLLGAVSGVIPALKAAHLNPVDALRG